jgi:hypothetical protein
MSRAIRTIGAALVVVVTALMSAVGVAEASTGPVRLQLLAEAQTKLLLSQYHGPPQAASPAECNTGQDPAGVAGVFLLPTLSFGSGDQTFTCQVKTGSVLVDLGGAVATEDARGDTYTTASGEVLLFTRANLERICDDVLLSFPPAAPATVDGNRVSGTQVSTPAFTAKVLSSSGQLWQDSVDLGHPGKLAASYCGWKAKVPLRQGRHVIQVDLSNVAGAPTIFTYNITVTS